jgi:CheY-like chemotaxis protein
VLLDVVLPGEDRFPVCERITQGESPPPLVVHIAHPVDGRAAPLGALLPGPQANDPFADVHRRLREFVVQRNAVAATVPLNRPHQGAAMSP